MALARSVTVTTLVSISPFLLAECPQTAAGLRSEIGKATISGKSAKVRISRGGAIFTSDFVVEDGEWNYVITDESREDYALGVEKAIAKRKGLFTAPPSAREEPPTWQAGEPMSQE